MDRRGPPWTAESCRRVVYIPPSDVFPPEGRWAAMTYEVQENWREAHLTTKGGSVFMFVLNLSKCFAHSIFAMCIRYTSDIQVRVFLCIAYTFSSRQCARTASRATFPKRDKFP